MSAAGRATACGRCRYRISVAGALPEDWRAARGLQVDRRDGVATFSAEVRDQAALLALLAELSSLGMPLQAVVLDGERGSDKQEP